MAIVVAQGTGQALTVPTRTPVAPTAGTFAYSKDTPGAAVYSNILNGLDQPKTIRYGITEVPNVFLNTPVDPIAGQDTRGAHYLIQINEVWKIYDDANPSVVPYYLPISAHMVLKLPWDPQVTAARVAPLIDRLIGAVCRNGTDALDVALNPFLHGIVRL